MEGDGAYAAAKARVQRLREIAAAGAREAAPELLAAVRATASAGQDPDGKPWPLTKEGKRALPEAGAAIRVSVTPDGAIELSIGAPYSYQKRQILPRVLTPRLWAALQRGIERAWSKLQGGG